MSVRAGVKVDDEKQSRAQKETEGDEFFEQSHSHHRECGREARITDKAVVGLGDTSTRFIIIMGTTRTNETSYLFSKLFFFSITLPRFLSTPKAISRSESHARIHSKRDVRTVDVVHENDDIEYSFFPQTREEEKCEDDDIILRVDERR